MKKSIVYIIIITFNIHFPIQMKLFKVVIPSLNSILDINPSMFPNNGNISLELNIHSQKTALSNSDVKIWWQPGANLEDICSRCYVVELNE